MHMASRKVVDIRHMISIVYYVTSCSLLYDRYSSSSQLLRRSLTLRSTAPILFNRLLRRALVRLELLDLRTIHMLHHLVRLPLLEAEPQPLVRIILVVRLIFMILDLDEIRVLRPRV